jgi:cell division control protein 11
MVIDTGDFSDTSIQPEELATQSVRLKEEQLRREEEKVGSYDFKLNCVFL